MIIDRHGSHFIFVLPRSNYYGDYNYINYQGKELTNKEYLDCWGKWIIIDNQKELAELAKKIDPYVEKKEIPAAKYDRKKIEEFELGECVMCVYCDMRQRDEVWDILSSFGVEDKMWVFERETVERWMPGGRLLERWISGKGLSPEQADRVRQEAKERFRKMFEDPDAVFRGVDQ